MDRRCLFIINPAAGNGVLKRWRRFADRLRAGGVSFEETISTSSRQALELAQQSAGTHDIIGAVGGDGTILQVVNGLMTSGGDRPALALVPLGTGNDTAHALGIEDESDALHAVIGRQVRPIDLIRVECQAKAGSLVSFAVSFASVGISTDVLRHTSPRMKRICGRRLAYMIGLLKALPELSAHSMEIGCDGEQVQEQCVLASASNGETFGGGIRVAPGALVDDGQLNLNRIRAVSRWEVLKQLRKLRHGRHVHHPSVCYRTSSFLEIRTEKPIEVAADGDIIGCTPARFEISPKALRVLVPGVSSCNC